jgi:hypothetical protein
MPGSRSAIDDLTERRRGSKTQVHRLPTPSDTGARRGGDFTLSQSLRVPARDRSVGDVGERTRFATSAAPLLGVLARRRPFPGSRRIVSARPASHRAPVGCTNSFRARMTRFAAGSYLRSPRAGPYRFEVLDDVLHWISKEAGARFSALRWITWAASQSPPDRQHRAGRIVAAKPLLVVRLSCADRCERRTVPAATRTTRSRGSCA